MFKRFRQYNQFLQYIENDLSPYCAINGMDTREIIVALIELGAYVFNGGPVPEYIDDTWRIERDERRDAERWHWELEQHKLSQTK